MDRLALLPELSAEDRPRDVVLYCSARLRRNLDGYLFASAAPAMELEELRTRCLDRLGAVYPRGDAYLSESVPQRPVLRALAERGGLAASTPGALHRAAFTDLASGTIFRVNESDHLLISGWSSGDRIGEAFERALAAELALDLPWAASLERGFLSADLDACGSGLSISALVFVPGILLSGLSERVFRSLAASGLEIGTPPFVVSECGEEDDAGIGRSGAFMELRARSGPDETEEGFLSRASAALADLAAGERRTLAKLLESRRLALEDRAYRARSLLGSCRLLPCSEALSLLSDYRLGLVAGFYGAGASSGAGGAKAAYGANPGLPGSGAGASPAAALNIADRALLASLPAAFRLFAQLPETASEEDEEDLQECRARYVRERLAAPDAPVRRGGFDPCSRV